jgi:TENA/THI-4/PQQC family
MGSGSLTAQLWSSIDATYGAILEHPLIAGLTDGSLDQAAFRFYVIQDAHYLREFARGLSVAAARAPEERDIAMFNEHAAGAIAVERPAARELFLRPWAQRDRRGGHGDGAHQPGLHQLPARRRLRGVVPAGLSLFRDQASAEASDRTETLRRTAWHGRYISAAPSGGFVPRCWRRRLAQVRVMLD